MVIIAFTPLRRCLVSQMSAGRDVEDGHLVPRQAKPNRIDLIEGFHCIWICNGDTVCRRANWIDLLNVTILERGES